VNIAEQDAFKHLLEQADRLTNTTPQHWREEPVGYKEFCETHLKFFPTERQQRTAFMLLGDDAKRTFENISPYRILCLIAGKGSGKDIFGATFVLYMFYLLLCLNNPRQYFGSIFEWEHDMPNSEAIDMLIISWTEEQARDVSFDKIKQFARHWDWLKQNFTIVEGERITTPHRDKPVIVILGDRITAVDFNIRIIAEHSKNESFEGYNVLCWVMSESCLRGRSRIRLADGREIPIAEIVNKKMPVQVLTRNFETGTLEPRLVTNWFKYPRRSHLLQVRVGHSRSQNTVDETLQCTPNHHVFTDRGYIRADELRVGDRMWVHGKFLSQWQREFVLGAELGDASFPHCSRLIQFTHGKKQKAYLEEIVRSFGALVTKQGIRWSASGYSKDPHGTGQLLISAMNAPEISAMCKSGGTKSVTKEWVDQLTLRSLAVWFMDDGSSNWPGRYRLKLGKGSNGKLYYRKGSYSVYLWCLDFSEAEARMLLGKLTAMGYRGHVHFRRSTKARKISRLQPYILLDVVSSERFLRDVSPYMFPSMAYKTPFPVPPIPVDDSTSCELISVQSIVAIDGRSKCFQKSTEVNFKPNANMGADDEWVYDIEVEHNHNYFAGDALVSNSAFAGKNKEANGWKVFNTLRSSSSSRYKFGWRGLVYSYIRGNQATDFTWQLYEQAAKDPAIWADLCYPWQFKPLQMEGDKYFDFEGIDVPIKYQDQALSDPATFRKMVLCQVPLGGEKALPMEVVQGALHRFPLLFTISNDVHLDGLGRYAVSGILNWLQTPKSGGHEYLITVDLGLKHAAAAIAASHLHPSMGYVLDAIGAWTPVEPSKQHPTGVPVDLEDVKQCLMKIAGKLPGCIIGFDQWQSALLQLELGTSGIRTEEYHVYEDRDYLLFRKALASRIAHVPEDPELIRQFNALTMDGKQVVLDTRISLRMDMIDVVVGGFKVLMKGYKPMVAGIPGAIYISDNLSQFGGTIVPMMPKGGK
jgi:hypothetical protein